jgi:glycosyltransferase involved in cell wall biosynthesis
MITACVFGLLATRKLALKRVATNHLWPRGNWELRVYEAIEALLYNGFDRVVAVSEVIEKECRPFIWKKDKITFIPNGINTRRFAFANREEERRTTRARMGLKETDLVVGNIARLSMEKDQSMLLQAFKILTDSRKNGHASCSWSGTARSNASCLPWLVNWESAIDVCLRACERISLRS